MRVLQFITLFLALAVVTGCSHRRTHRPVATTASLCECSICRSDQERLIREGAVPAEHFQNYSGSETSEPIATAAPLAAPPTTNDFAPVYASEQNGTANTVSPFASGNPIEMDSEAPGAFTPPVVDEIKTDSTQFPLNNLSDDLKLDLRSSSQITPLNQVPSETFPDGAFKPFDRDVFKAKSKVDNAMPLEQQPSILIDKVSESRQPDLSSFVAPQNLQLQLPQLDEQETNDFQIPDSIDSDSLSLEPTQTEMTEPVESVAENFQPYLSQLEPAADTALPAPQESVPMAQPFTPVAQAFVRPIRQTETVVQGELYEDPIVLYARQRRDLLTATPVQRPGAVKPASGQKPVEHQGIVQNSEYDPIYGLPLTNNVDFDSLPAIEQPPVVPPAQAQAQHQAQPQPQHLHVHIHHDYSNDAAGQVRQIQQTDQQAKNVQVMYRDDEGRIIMAPPTPTTGTGPAVPTGDRRTYYVPPEQILRLKATSPISRQRSNPSVASIQMRDTIIHGGSHLLATPDYQAQPVLTNHGLPGINHEKLREAFNTSPTENPLR